VAPADPPVRDSTLLTGTRILDFTFQGAGAYASMLLAALGADVIKVESSHRPDPTRGRENRPYLRSLLFDDVNLGKRAISLDMKTDQGRRVARRLAEQCDGVVDNFRPGVMQRWGIDFETISAANPRVVSASLSAMGSGGPLADLPGYAGIFNALSGLGGLNGYADGPPTELRTSVDMRAGAFFAFSVTQGLLAARMSGAGSRIDLSATECITALTGEYLAAYLLLGDEPVRIGNAVPGTVAHGVYASADEAWVAVAVRTKQEWERLALPADDRDRPGETLARWLAGIAAAEAVARLQMAGAAAAVIEDAPALAADPQLAHRRFFTELPPRSNGERRMAAAAPWLVNGERPPVRPGPELGSDTTAVLREVLAMTDEEITMLSESGALR
jgi:crotonobetainyl-CoA:carnitine CoA-transferase CaiB-like acyl-CoA transferase